MSEIRDIMEESDMEFSFSVGENQGEIFTIGKRDLMKAIPIFSAIFNGSFQECSQEDIKIRVEDVKPSAFKILLDYCKDEELEINENNWASTLYAAEKYGVSGLKKESKFFVKSRMNPKNVFHFYIEASLNRVLHLLPYLKDSLILNCEEYFFPSKLLSIPNNEILNDIISSDFLALDEMNVFKGCISWATSHINSEDGLAIREALGPVIFSIRFQQLSFDELMNEVYPTGVLTEDEMLNIFMSKSCSSFVGNDKFPSCSRASRCLIPYYFRDYGSKQDCSFSLSFRTKNAVNISGFGIGDFSGPDVVMAEMILKSEVQNEILSEITVEDFLKNTIVKLQGPISIQPNIFYTVEIKLSKFIDISFSYSKFNVSEILTNGVEWDFEPSALKLCLISCIYFSKID